MSVGRICTRVVATAGPGETVRVAAARMAEHNVGTVMVVDDEKKPLSILTDGDEGGSLAGILSVDDILELLAEELRTVGDLLHDKGPGIKAEVR